MSTPFRCIVRVIAVAVLTLATAATFAVAVPIAEAQTAVTGTADFRNAPQLVDGSFRDQLVTGDSAWYSVIYKNDDPYRFEAVIDGAAPADVDINISFVAPTLDTVDGPGSVVDGSGVAYPLGETNQWFLKVSLDTTGQAGVELPIRIMVQGVLDVGTEPCSDVADCTLDEELSALNGAIADAEAELAVSDPQNTTDAVERELTGLRRSAESAATDIRPTAEGRLARAEARLAELCAPETSCDEIPAPAPKTPLVGWLLGLAVLGFGARKALKKIQAARPKADDKSEGPGDANGPGRGAGGGGSEADAAVTVAPVERAPIAL